MRTRKRKFAYRARRKLRHLERIARRVARGIDAAEGTRTLAPYCALDYLGQLQATLPRQVQS